MPTLKKVGIVFLGDLVRVLSIAVNTVVLVLWYYTFIVNNNSCSINLGKHIEGTSGIFPLKSVIYKT